MSCNTNRNLPLSCVFAAVASPGCGQFFDPGNFSAEQIMYDTSYSDLINNFGIPVNYYINTYNLSSADNLYGEQPTAVFYGPITIMMFVELNENAINLSKFGFASDDELTGYVHIKTFSDEMAGKEFYILASDGSFISYTNTQTFLQGGDFSNYFTYINNGQSIEPKSGDLIELTPLGCDRPNGRGPKIFEITERTDQDVSSINPLLGHYVYRLRAKRYEYSFEPGAPQEQENNQVYENTFSGKISSSIPDEGASDPKSYPTNIESESKSKVLDMTVNNTDIYGEYY